MTGTPLDIVEQILADGNDADAVLREVVSALVEHGGCTWAAILFVEDGALVLGPAAGDPRPTARTQLPVVFQNDRVAEFAADGCGDLPFLERIAEILAPYCLVGWDTGGVAWDAVS
jgi:hypothetical protein